MQSLFIYKMLKEGKRGIAQPIASLLKSKKKRAGTVYPEGKR